MARLLQCFCGEAVGGIIINRGNKVRRGPDHAGLKSWLREALDSPQAGSVVAQRHSQRFHTATHGANHAATRNGDTGRFSPDRIFLRALRHTTTAPRTR